MTDDRVRRLPANTQNQHFKRLSFQDSCRNALKQSSQSNINSFLFRICLFMENVEIHRDTVPQTVGEGQWTNLFTSSPSVLIRSLQRFLLALGPDGFLRALSHFGMMRRHPDHMQPVFHARSKAMALHAVASTEQGALSWRPAKSSRKIGRSGDKEWGQQTGSFKRSK